VWCIWAVREKKISPLLLVGLALSILMVLSVRAPMLIAHHYYLGAGVVFFLLWMLGGVKSFVQKYPRTSQALAFLYFAVAVANVQHLWRRQTLKTEQEVNAAIAEAGVPPGEQLAVY